MNNSITEYLSTIEFPKLIEEKSAADCFENFRQDYDLLSKSFGLKLSPLTEESDNHYLITALLKTLAEREILLQREINQLLQVLIPTPENNKKVGAKNQQLDEIIALFGMRREFSVGEESKDKLYETDEALKKRIASRLGILSKTGTKTAYTHMLLSLEPSINDIAIINQDSKEQKNLAIYLLPKIEIFINDENKAKTSENVVVEWFAKLEFTLKSKIKQQDIIPIRDEYTLSNGKIIRVEVQITCTAENSNDKATIDNIKKTCRSYFNKKYKFNAFISNSELLSYFDYSLIEKLDIKLNKTDEDHILVLNCSENEAPLLEKLTINTKEYNLKEILE